MLKRKGQPLDVFDAVLEARRRLRAQAFAAMRRSEAPISYAHKLRSQGRAQAFMTAARLLEKVIR